MEEQTYFVRVNRKDPVSGVIFDVVKELDNVTKDVALRVFSRYPLINGYYSWQLWDNLKDDWLDAYQFVEDNK